MDGQYHKYDHLTQWQFPEKYDGRYVKNQYAAFQSHGNYTVGTKCLKAWAFTGIIHVLIKGEATNSCVA